MQLRQPKNVVKVTQLFLQCTADLIVFNSEIVHSLNLCLCCSLVTLTSIWWTVMIMKVAKAVATDVYTTAVWSLSVSIVNSVAEERIPRFRKN